MHRLPQCNIDYQGCLDCEKKAGWTAVFINFCLALFKIIVGILSGSKAVLADALYSVKDFLTSLVVVVGMKVSGKPPDEKHPYGHGKIEYVAIFLISLFIIIGTIFVFIHSVKYVWFAYQGNIHPPKFIAFWAALISMAANYKLSTYLYCVGSRTKSPVMLANAEHNHSDAISSALVAGAIAGTQLGYHFLDPLAAVLEILDLMRLSVVMLNESLQGIMDSAVSDQEIVEIKKTAALVPGVIKISSVLARKVGHGIWVDMVIRVEHDLPLDHGHKIGRQLEDTLRKHYGTIEGINLSIKPDIIA